MVQYNELKILYQFLCVPKIFCLKPYSDNKVGLYNLLIFSAFILISVLCRGVHILLTTIRFQKV